MTIAVPMIIDHCGTSPKREIADGDAKNDRCIFKRRDRGDVGVAVALCQQYLRKPSEYTRTHQQNERGVSSGTHPNGMVKSDSTVAESEK